MTISFEIPRNIEQRLLTEGADPNREAKEVYLIDLYRQDRITHDDLSEALRNVDHAQDKQKQPVIQ